MPSTHATTDATVAEWKTMCDAARGLFDAAEDSHCMSKFFQAFELLRAVNRTLAKAPPKSFAFIDPVHFHDQAALALQRCSAGEPLEARAVCAKAARGLAVLAEVAAVEAANAQA